MFERLKTLLTDTMIVQFALIEYLVHGVFGDDLEAPQGDAYVHKHDGDRPESDDGKDAHKRINPNRSPSDIQLQTKK